MHQDIRYKEQILLFLLKSWCTKTHNHSKLLELFLGSGCFGDLQDVEPDSLAEWSALTDGHDVSDGHIPGADKNKKIQVTAEKSF